MRPNYTIREREKGNFGKTMLAIAVGGGLGYGVNEYIIPKSGFIIEDGYIRSENMQPREITTEHGIIQVGTTKERVNDLLYENPTIIKKTVEELFTLYTQE